MLHITPETLTYLTELRLKQEVRREEKAVAKAARRLRELSDHRRGVLAERASRILRQGVSSMFEHEGAVRRGLRVGLITQGWKWPDADSAAANVIDEAFKILGVVRPTYAQGQPECLEHRGGERWFCACCGTLFPDEDRRPGRQYCSKQCASVAYLRRARASGVKYSLAEYQARLSAQKENTILERSCACENCGTPIITDRSFRRFCSAECTGEANFRHEKKPCGHCGELFQPKSRGPNDPAPKYCSYPCFTAGNTKLQPRPCDHCGETFKPKRAAGRFCSRPCAFASRVPQPSPFTCEETN